MRLVRRYKLQSERVRKMVAVTLSDEARARLAELARVRKRTKSEIVEALIMKEHE